MAGDTKERILEAALALFAQNGYLGTSMNDIAGKLGITKAALYMKYMLIKELYDCFYTTLEFSVPRQEIEYCHKALTEVLEKPERRLVLHIIDAKDRIVEDTSIDSFISGFELAWQLSMELNNYENERFISCQSGRLGARFLSRRDHHKEETT